MLLSWIGLICRIDGAGFLPTAGSWKERGKVLDSDEKPNKNVPISQLPSPRFSLSHWPTLCQFTWQKLRLLDHWVHSPLIMASPPFFFFPLINLLLRTHFTHSFATMYATKQSCYQLITLVKLCVEVWQENFPHVKYLYKSTNNYPLHCNRKLC